MAGERNDAEMLGQYYIFFHLTDEERLLENRSLQHRVIPQPGEYVTFTVDGEWYEVDLTVHCAITDEDRTFDAEVWLHRVDHLAVLGTQRRRRNH